MTEADDLMKRVEQLVNEHNKKASSIEDRFSPDFMHQILYNLFNPACPLKLKVLNKTNLSKVPIFNLCAYVMRKIEAEGDIKLTKLGAFPVSLVKDLYAQAYKQEYYIDSGLVNLRKESDSESIYLTHLILLAAGMCKKRLGKLSLTAAGKKLLKDEQQLLEEIIRSFANQLNWAALDGYGDNPVGQLGIGYTLVMLNKYGNTMRPIHFYGEKYLDAIPAMLNFFRNEYRPAREMALSCFSIRTMERFLDYLGVVELDKPRQYSSVVSVKKTPLFDLMFDLNLG